jgi:hypothetical protein
MLFFIALSNMPLLEVAVGATLPEYPSRMCVLSGTDHAKEHAMRSTEICALIDQGILLAAPVRARGVADIPRVRAVFAAPRR